MNEPSMQVISTKEADNLINCVIQMNSEADLKSGPGVCKKPVRRLMLSFQILGVFAIFCIPSCLAVSSVTTITRVSVQGSYSHHAVQSSQSDGGLVGYHEDTESVRGNITYEKTFQSGTISGVRSSRTISYNSSQRGSMSSNEEIITHTCDAEGRSTARTGSVIEVTNATISSNVDAGNASLLHDIRIRGTKGNSLAAGLARVHIDVAERSGTGSTSYEEITSVDGLFTLDKDVSYGN